MSKKRFQKARVKTKAKAVDSIYGHSDTVRWIDLIRAGFYESKGLENDYYISLLQLLKRKGYTPPLCIYHGSSILTMISNMLFRYQIPAQFNAEDENCVFDLIKWRSRIDIYSLKRLNALNFYKDRKLAEGKDFKEFGEIRNRILMHPNSEESKDLKTLNVSLVNGQEEVKQVLDCYIEILPNHFEFNLILADKENAQKKANRDPHDYHRIALISKDRENYVDFCKRIDAAMNKFQEGDCSFLETRFNEYCFTF